MLVKPLIRPKEKISHISYQSLLLIVSLLAINLAASASNDSLLKSIKVGYSVFNDNNPIDNQQNSYDDRKRDDHGLTFLLGYDIEARFSFFTKAITSIAFTNQSALYTRGLGTLTEIARDNPYFDDYAYLLDLHPDWSKLLINDQISYSKNIKELSIINHYNKLSIGLSFRYSSIYSGENQKMADIQRSFHEFMKSRNYYHVPFTDSSIFKGKNINYFSFSPVIAYNEQFINTGKWSLIGSIGAMLWVNSLSDYKIPSISPIATASLKLGYGKTFTNRERKLNLDYGLHFEPNAIVQDFSDPGTEGYHYLGLTLNFASKKAKEKSCYLLYTLSPYSVYLPIGIAEDPTFNYKPRKGDLRIVESFFNLSISLRFNN